MKANMLKIEKSKDAETAKLKKDMEKKLDKKESKLEDWLNDNAER